ncbi:MAG: DUF3575 domain-containing protein [Muribaculaceae bacterium]|nr:DUF3575 domain-containing protein [Muribaculaceae bacterium]
MTFKRIVALSFIFFPLSYLAFSQKVGIKTNILSDVFTTPSLGVEYRVSNLWTIDFSAQLNAWNINGRRWRHWMLQAEARRWYRESLKGSFFGAHIIVGQFNIGNINTKFKFLGTDFSKLKDNRYQGWGGGLGLAYGYAWNLARHWNLEAEVGIGWICTRYDKYPCAECGSVIRKGGNHNYFGPTKLCFAVEYIL